MIKKIKKYFEYVETILYKNLNEKKKFIHNQKISYLFEKNRESDRLIVVFSACTREGVPARYNYVRTLKERKENKIFILDNLGEDRRGSYYLGKFPKFEFEKAVKELLDQVISENNIKSVIFCGSSKGGYAAINFGIMYNDSVGEGIIIGAPQFWLGEYLSAPANRVTLEGICDGNNKNKVVSNLNERLKNKIDRDDCYRKQKIYIHYSIEEHTYKEHIQDLCKQLRENGYELIENVESYKEHSEVSLYFPKYLKELICKIWND